MTSQHQSAREQSQGQPPRTHYEIKATNLTDEDRKFLEEHSDLLSKSTLRAKWIHSPDEHEDYHGQTLATRSHEVIRQWAEERKATPATVESTEHYPTGPGVLRFDFPNFGGQSLKHISWDEWFRVFDERNLVFIYQETQKSGRQSNFFRLDSPEREDA